MNYPVELLAEVDLYLSNQLNDPARCRAIEARMERDAEFRGVVEAMRQSRQLIDEPALRELARTVIRNLDAAQLPVQPLPGRSRSLWPVLTGIAAMLVLLSGAYLTQRSLTLATLGPLISTLRGAEPTTAPGLNPAEQQAVAQFDAGNRAFTAGQYDQAIARYKVTDEAPVSDYLHECAWWNLSLTYLKTGDTRQASRYFGQYSNLAKPHYPTPWLDRATLRAHLLWQRVFGA